MEQFKKWYNQTIRPYIHNPKDKELREEGWRAALEWAQDINKKITEEHTDSQYGAIKQSIAIDAELRGD